MRAAAWAPKAASAGRPGTAGRSARLHLHGASESRKVSARRRARLLTGEGSPRGATKAFGTRRRWRLPSIVHVRNAAELRPLRWRL